jgi:protein O-mannosyl-transferase
VNESTDNAVNETWRSLGAGAAFFLLVTIVLYLPSLQGGFVWDDNILIAGNPLIKASDGLYRFWFTTEARDYYPLTWSFWWIQWRLWGGSASGYHAVNILLHALNAVAIWILLRRLAIPGALWAALVFAIHPVNVATVAWISEQKNTLSLFFSLMAILLYLKFDKENRWQWLGFSLAAFLLALLAKSAVAMLPVVLLGCVWWRHGQVRRKDVIFISPYFVLSLILGLATVWFQYHRVLDADSVRTDGFPSHLIIAGCAPWFYLYKALLPFDLSAIYPRWDINPANWISYVPGTALVGCFALFWWKRKTWGRPLLFGFGCFVVMLFPVLGFFNQDFYQYSFVADPWQYYSIAGIIGLAVAAGMSLNHRLDRQQQSWAAVAGLAVLLALGSSTWTRANVYASEKTLWEDTAGKNPNSWVVHYNLGTWLLEAARFDQAIVQFREAARLRPDLAKVHTNLGIALAQDDKLPEAVAEFERTLQINPNLFEVQGNLGHVLVLLGRVPEAIAHWEQALRIKPDSAEVHYDLGVTFEQVGRPDAAIEQYELALKFKPDMVDAQNQLTRLRAGQHPSP